MITVTAGSSWAVQDGPAIEQAVTDVGGVLFLEGDRVHRWPFPLGLRARASAALGYCTPTPALPFCHLPLRARKPPSPGYPLQPQTLGEHLKKRRLDLGLRQKDLARRLETSLFNIWNWERNVTGPSLRFLPRIIRFLGYSPLDTSDLTLGQQILTYRRLHGLRQEDLARQLGVDPSTLASWERGSHKPTGKRRERLESLLAAARPGLPPLT
jgi:transcriptional regulator with XRE-family HTH domain